MIQTLDAALCQSLAQSSSNLEHSGPSISRITSKMVTDGLDFVEVK
jgi:hypothetical protein